MSEPWIDDVGRFALVFSVRDQLIVSAAVAAWVSASARYTSAIRQTTKVCSEADSGYHSLAGKGLPAISCEGPDSGSELTSDIGA